MGYSSSGKGKDFKQQVDYAEVLYKQIDRLGEAAMINKSLFIIGVDVLATLVSFLKDDKGSEIVVEKKENLTEDEIYEAALVGLSKIIKLLDHNDLILKYRMSFNASLDDDE